MEKGLAHGSFKIDSKWRPGSYYIKAGTQWMQNFEEDHPFIQKIEIIEDYPSDEDFTVEKNYDVQILPEGGHLILGVENMVGVRIVDQNGKGVAVENGTIYDSENKAVADVYTNEAGVGRFRLIPGKGISYHLKLEVDVDKVVNTELPNAKPIGITMAVNNILEDKLVISVNTNQETLDQLDQNTFHLAVHRDGIMTLNSFVMDSTTRSIKISKKNVLPGTNIITLFDQELEPISERLIFNFQRAKIANAQISKLSSGKDSVSLKIQTSAKKAVPITMSVSALPTASTSNQTNVNIISSLLLEPYMQSKIENPSRYFAETDRTKQYELDLALSTQGWSSYNWEIIRAGKPGIAYPYESGTSANVTLNTSLKKEEKLALVPEGISSMVFLDLSDSTSVKLTDLYVRNGDTLNFSIKKKRGGLKKPKLDVTFSIPNLKKDSIDSATLEKLRNEYEPSLANLESNSTFREENPISPKSIVALKEVTVTENKTEKKLTRKHPLVNPSYKGVKVDEAELRKSPFLTDLIRRNGFRVWINPSGNGNVFITNNFPARGAVRVYDDDVPIQDLNQILNVPLNQIDEVYFETQGLSGDINSSGGVIRIYRRLGTSLQISRPNFAEKLVENSFSRPKEFYRPKYISTENEAYEKYGIVHWEPQLKTNKNGEVELKIPREKLSSFKVFIEGMGNDGSLLSHTEEITLD